MKASVEALQAKQGLNWAGIFWVSFMHSGLLLAPFCFTWSGVVICGVLYLFTGLGITLGYHRLLTHRSFRTPRWIEYGWALLGALANQGGPIKWAAAHRQHHAFSDDHGDPHTPREGTLWAHMVWWMVYHPVLDHPLKRHQNVKDLKKDALLRFLDRWELLPPALLAVSLYAAGQFWDGVGLSWLVYGIFVRTVLLFHATWFVNSATHLWGYRNFETPDQSTNLWWVALITFGEGWHNNHHAYQRSARHGIRWYEFDLTFLTIRMLSFLGLAREIHIAPKPSEKPPRRCRVIRPRGKPRRKSEVVAVS